MKRVLLLLPLLLVSLSHAAPVYFDFSGVIEQSTFEVGNTSVSGTLSFDPDAATPDEAWGYSYWTMPTLFSVQLGPYAITGTNGPQFMCNKDGFEFLDTPIGNNTIATNSNFFARGSLFDSDPENSLSGGRWANLAPMETWSVNTYGEDEEGNSLIGAMYVRLSNWSLRQPTEEGIVLGGGEEQDAIPTPEPGSFVLMGSALLGLAGARRLRRKSSGRLQTAHSR